MSLPSPPQRILLVDDEVALRTLLRKVLERSGRYEVIGEASDGREALQLAEAHGPDTVLLDLSMPRMDGLEALPHLRRLLPHARIVVLSGFTPEGTAAVAMKAGADAYLEKGLSPRELLQKLDAVSEGPEGHLGSDADRVNVARPQPFTSLSDTVARLSHDVRTPLTIATASLELLSSVLPDEVDDDIRELIGSAGRSLGRAERTLAAAVEHARTGQAPLNPSEVSLTRIIGEAVEAASHSAERLLVIPDPSARVFADVDALQRVLSNLVENALRYSAGKVEIEVRSGSAGVAIEVRDDGPGLGEDPDRLFEPFVRGESAGQVEGSGLGLATAADLVRRMSGELSAQDLPGRGAVFTVTLPGI